MDQNNNLTKKQVQDTFVEFLNRDPQQAMSLIGGLWLHVNLEYIRQNGHNANGRIDLKTGVRNVTVWPDGHEFEEIEDGQDTDG